MRTVLSFCVVRISTLEYGTVRLPLSRLTDAGNDFGE